MNNNSGIGFTGFLQLIFIVLKLTKIINWSWIWVFSPFWISLLLLIIALIIYLLISKKEK